MKKILFALVCVLTIALTSCFEGTGNNASYTFSRVVTIDATSSPVKFVADYTGEEFDKFTNLKTPEQLKDFDLEDALRAEVYMQLDINASYEQTWTMLKGKKIDIIDIANKVTTDTMPLLGLRSYPLGGTPYSPTVWVSNGYLNVLPIVPSKKSAKYSLTPEKAVNDSLYFNLTATYEEDSLEVFAEDIHCYDLRTLRDTANADAKIYDKMREVLTAMEAHRRDSMRVFVSIQEIDYNYNYLGEDTIRKINHISNYFKYDF